jgi:hypothetical protein
MCNTRWFVSCCGALLLAVMATGVASGSPEGARTTSLTFSQPVGLPGVTLGAGTYVFERATVLTSHNVVRVMSGDRKRVVFQGFTELVRRPAGLRGTVVTFAEATREHAQPIIAWYPSGSAHGYKFGYQ